MIRSTKRITIITIYVILFLMLGGWIVSLFIPKPTCFDGIQNQKEEGIDCGGPCNACVEEITGKDLIVKDARIVYGGENKYDVVAEIHNPNALYGAKKVYYTVEIKDATGKTLDYRDGNTFVLPNENKYIMELALETKQKPTNAKVTINDVDWVKFTEFVAPQIEVKNQRFGLVENGPSYAEAFGLVVNNSLYDFHNVNIYVILQDERGIPIAVNKTQMRTLDANSRRTFKLVWPHEFPGKIASSKMQAETNVFDSLNFMKKYLPSGKYQEFVESE